jgi:multicomponent Na+:H+ antiporter subunit E
MLRWDALRSGDHRRVRALVMRTVIFAIAWWAVAEGRTVSWMFIVAGVGGASMLSLVLLPPGRWTLLGVARFVPFFLVESVRGGVDVALRAFGRGPRIAPGWVEHSFESDDPDVQLVVANALSLMPGTLCARLEHGRAIVHVLDMHSPAARFAPILEERVSAMTDTRDG